MRVVLTGGGTGGHIYPALAIGHGIKQVNPEAKILYIGSKNGMESQIVPRAGFNFKAIDISGINRSSMLKASRALIRFPSSVFQSWNLLKSFQPDVVVGTGGYVSFPVVMAATFQTCKTVIHEQNAVPGLANRNLAKRVDWVLLTFPEAKNHLSAKNIKVTGLPVRQELLQVNREEARKKFDFSPQIFTLIAFGGSRGAMSINRAMLEMLDKYLNIDIQIIWITGDAGYEDIRMELAERQAKKNYRIKLFLAPYLYNIEEALAIADLAVCRAGASTISELAILGLPAILIPYPYAADNHQEKNARALVAKKAVDMVIDEFLDGYTLNKKVSKYYNNPSLLAEMKTNLQKEARPDALRDIINTIIEM
ncbi:MAG: undecaprenyldiphospho-muramoylpentapeptide beta-N-acetylglucosaminyltransferase [Syntrophomonadaceae bacterium]|jgi:UDP-N-acetylglucosamine--N-acetylmuramyl-(pentapeptide) pyrophosphoryl-undecaprenol N-acetylglucosamine transferase